MARGDVASLLTAARRTPLDTTPATLVAFVRGILLVRPDLAAAQLTELLADAGIAEAAWRAAASPLLTAAGAPFVETPTRPRRRRIRVRSSWSSAARPDDYDQPAGSFRTTARKLAFGGLP